MDKSQTQTTTRAAIDAILKGEPPNGLQPEPGDVLAECYCATIEAWHAGGIEAAKRAYAAYLKANQAAAQAMGRPPLEPWTAKNAPKTADYVRVLEALGYTFRMNLCNNAVEVNGERINDALESRIRCQLRDLGYFRVNVAADAWTAHALDNAYHPVRDFLAGLRWDGNDHIAALLGHITSDRGDLALYLRRWLIGACAKAYSTGTVQNRMLVLDGEQGIGKSRLVRWLAEAPGRPELFVEGPINPASSHDEIRQITAWIWEVSELTSTTSNADRNKLKEFLSKGTVTVHAPYAHHDLVKPALASFFGTVNNVGGFLNDPTGSRRFMVAHVEAIDWDYTRLDARQVWAQAYALYKAGEPWELSPSEAAAADATNSEYEVSDPLEDILMRLYEPTGNRADFVSAVDIRDALHMFGWSLQHPRGEAMAIADALRARQIEPGRAMVNGKRERGYVGLRRRV